MKHFTAYQWIIGLAGLAFYFKWILGLWQDALHPKTELTRYQRWVRFTSAFVFSIAILFAIPYWLGIWG